MNYSKEPLQLDNPLEFWLNFEGEERVFWVDRQSDRVVVGAKRLAVVKDDEERKDYAYVFYGGTFFPTVKDEKWKDMGHEMVAFTHYYIVENGESFYLHAGDAVEIQRHTITRVDHAYAETSDDKQNWDTLMDAILTSIHVGKMTKVVSSREVEFTSPTPYQMRSLVMPWQVLPLNSDPKHGRKNVS